MIPIRYPVQLIARYNQRTELQPYHLATLSPAALCGTWCRG